MAGAPSIVVHAGAGTLGRELRERAGEVTDVLRSALSLAAGSLQQGADAVSVAVEVVRAMEDFELFNAGYGAALCADGSVELSASLMRGSDQAAGAVAGSRTIRNPVTAARLVLDTPQVLMIGERADALAAAAGLEQWNNSAFVTEKQRARLRASPTEEDENRGTVGAVCLDAHGGLAAATSTGGITGQPPGRVGDSPLIGAGTWADDRVAVSCTGDGEAFVRVGAARLLAAKVQAGAGVEEASEQVLGEVRRLGGHGGLIALRRDGATGLSFSTAAMPRGVWTAGEDARVWLGQRAQGS